MSLFAIGKWRVSAVNEATSAYFPILSSTLLTVVQSFDGMYCELPSSPSNDVEQLVFPRHTVHEDGQKCSSLTLVTNGDVAWGNGGFIPGTGTQFF